MVKVRIDQYILEKYNVGTLEDIQKLIMAGKVLCNDQPVYKASEQVNPKKANIRFKKIKPYVSRGGIKLQDAIQQFNINLKSVVFLDIGSSTGGFTDCALKYGAKKVYAVDVGTNQLDYKLRSDDRVVVMEQTNFKNTTIEQFEPLPQVISIDVSFTSIIPIFRHIKTLFNSQQEIIALVKPQFESYKEEIENDGLIQSKHTHINVLTRVIKESIALGFKLKQIKKSPITGTKGNTEYLLYLTTFKDEIHLTFDLEKIVNE